jgi:hypothetical protein
VNTAVLGAQLLTHELCGGISDLNHNMPMSLTMEERSDTKRRREQFEPMKIKYIVYVI